MSDNPVEGLFGWLADLILHAFFIGTPEEGMRASAILFIASFASNAIGLVFTIILDVLFATLFVIHLFRYLWKSR